MNIKELEALVIKQGEYLQAAERGVREQAEAHMHLVQRADNIVEGFKKELLARDERLVQMSTALDAAREQLALVNVQVEKLQGWIGADSEDGPFHDEFKSLTARLTQIETLVLARNASAATKRNMTDDDALRVLTGDLKDLSHKDAAEKIGLTYAQVYSCRGEFTFKHVHKALRDASTSDAPWKNPWAK